ncbi:MAG: MFS transporter [Hamadaea sp.]|uniref:MFS transporter n=1 Tax=Hamadaea sp. TaxID=2024425 RepID=UPI001792F788|nr:MFS transporter [Hamadaea sp.]NUR72037.1 MFS transporter [Hamadaea sp.]NUT17587.1 MFS transporter [Hamadaea sp.]
MSFTSTRWRDVWIAAGSNAVTNMASFLVLTTLMLALQEEGRGGPAVAAVIIAESLPIVLLAAITGRLADRLDSRLLLVVAGGVQVGACLALSMVDDMAPRVMLLTLVFVGTAIAQPVRQALMMTMAAREDLPKVSGISQTAASIGAIAGPAAAGFAQDGLGTQATLRVAAVAFSATIIAGLLFQTRRGGDRLPADARTDNGPVRMDSLLRVVTIGFAVVVGCIAAANVVEVFYVKETLGASSSAYGLINSMWTVGMIGGTWLVARLVKQAGDTAIVVGAFSALALTCSILAVSSQAPAVAWIVPLWLLGGGLNGAENVQVFTVFGRRAPEHARGRLSARLNASVQGAALLGYAMGGLVLEWWQPRTVLLVGGLLGVVAVIVLAPWIRAAVRRERGREPNRITDTQPSGAVGSLHNRDLQGKELQKEGSAK